MTAVLRASAFRLSVAFKTGPMDTPKVAVPRNSRALADSSKRASEPDAEPRPRARWSTHYSPRTHVPLTWRLRRAVAVWPEGTGLTPAPAFRRRRHLLLHGHRAASPGAASLGAATRAAPPRAASPAQRRLRLACAAPPAPRCLCRAACAAPPAPRRLCCAAAPGAASPGSASHRAASPVRPCLRPAPPCEDITKCSLYTLVCRGSLPAAYRKKSRA